MQREKKREVERTDLECTICEHIAEFDSGTMADFLEELYGQALESSWNEAMQPRERADQFAKMVHLRNFLDRIQAQALDQFPHLQKVELAA